MAKSLSLLLLVLLPLGQACKADLSDLQVLDVGQLRELLDSDSDLVICDANNDDTRGRFGVIPGAVLLSNYRDYDVTAELPAEKSRQLVFYCHSEMCGAAGDAARKALAAGHQNVWVLAAGIKGWAGADEAVDRPESGRGAS